MDRPSYPDGYSLRKRRAQALAFAIFRILSLAIVIVLFAILGFIVVKGAGVIMSTVLLETIGMPLSLIPILAAIWPAIDPCHTVLNNVGDLIGTTIISRQLGEMDMDVYESNK